ncbi:MAG: poly-beta-1,6-N-acetyl-D-glucosamine N-deacetylase PgaB [Gammaproteobacteria bacterium]|nr:MAG: poly-beta-1,6-N-acetyl-D-glucosamine N-deacetylase PgaB [Gammaproteobacteria bacterium]
MARSARRLSLLLCACAFLALSAVAGERPRSDFEVLCYHEVRDDVVGDLDRDPYAVSTDHLVRHLNWLRDHGYRPVSIDDLIAAREGRRPLPDKAVLLTFDDGYRSFYTRIYPLLKLYGYPAVMALVTSWLEAPPGSRVLYGNEYKAREEFLTWEQIREMQASGLVEFASHSHDLHHGIQGNPQGNAMPAAVTRRYVPGRGYESEAAYRARVSGDLARSMEIIERRTGRRPRVMVWPYGAHTLETVEWAAGLGLPITLTLEDDTPPTLDHLERIGRHLIERNPGAGTIAAMLRREPDRTPLRVAHVDLDYLYDPDPAAQAANLDRLVSRIYRLQPSAVFLQAYADPDGDGTADALYFRNRHLPMRADLFSRVAWQLRTRAGVQVYAWLPVLAFDLPDAALARRLGVQRDDGEIHAPGRYRRLSPFQPEARRIIRQIYADLGRAARFAGLLFHDDATLDDHEDAGPAALRVYREQWHLPDSLEALRADPATAGRWARLKAQWLTDFTLELAAEVRRYQPALRTARNLYARAILEPESVAWLGQDYRDFLRAYDYTAVMAMPYMEGAREPLRWLDRLADRVLALGNDAARHTLFELQARDWRSGRTVHLSELEAWINLLRNRGIRHLGYYPDDFIAGQPPLQPLHSLISVSDYPYPRP